MQHFFPGRVSYYIVLEMGIQSKGSAQKGRPERAGCGQKIKIRLIRISATQLLTNRPVPDKWFSLILNGLIGGCLEEGLFDNKINLKTLNSLDN